MRKKLLLLLFFLVGVWCMNVQAQDTSGTCGTNLYWSYNTATKTLTITGSGPMKNYDTDDKTPWYPWHNVIEKVEFPEGLISIGSCAFYQCAKLANLDFPESLIRIESNAFSYCYDVKTVRMGNNVQSVGGYAFYYCNKLEMVDFGESPASIGTNAFYPANSLTTIKAKKIKSIGMYAFSGGNKLVNLELGDSLTSIGQYAFQSCSALKALHFPATFSSMYDNSFLNCNGLDTITVHPNNRTYDSRNNCNAVIVKETNSLILGCAKTVIPSDILSIGNNAFYSCYRLQSITLPEGLQTLGGSAFYNCSQLTSVTTLPQSVNSVGCYAFSGCSKLTEPIYNDIWFAYLPANYEGDYVLPSTIQEVACGAFQSCSKMTGVTMTDRIKAIRDYTFTHCYALQAIDIPDSVVSIGSYAFQSCSSLTALSFPADLKSIGSSMLQGCNKLKTIEWNVRTYQSVNVSNTWSDPFNGIRSQITSMTFGDSVQVIPANLCYDMDKLTSLSLGCNVTTIGSNAFEGCKNIKTIDWNLRTMKDPVIYTNAPFYPLRDSITTFNFGDSVRHIPAYLCHSMSKLHQIYLPEKVSSIGAFAFRYMGVLDSISVDENNDFYDSRNDCNALIETSSDILMLGCYKTVIPSDIKGIGECAFRNVRNLTSVTLADDVTFVGKEAFNGCKDLKELSLSDQITRIEDYAFQACDSLQFLTLPTDLETVGFRAFAQCTGLKDINCQSENPATIDVTSFSGTTCPIHVPCAFIADYRSAAVWSDFGNRLTGEALYTLTIQPNEFAYGKVRMIQQPDCEHNAIIEAEPARNYVFMYWQDESGEVLSSQAHYEFAVEEDLNLTAVFARITEGLDEIMMNETAIWYDIMGRRVSEPTTGMYIVVIGNETYKVQR